MKQEYVQSPQELIAELNTSADGLSSAEAAARLEKYGPNKLKDAEKPTLLQRFIEQLKDPMLIILMIAAAVSAVTNFISGESFAEVFIILIVVLLNAVLGVFQESKAEAAIEALQTMTAATCKVLRDGKQVSIHSDQLVPGDVVLLEAGDAVPADGRLLESASLKIEEAALTGESVPVNKVIEALGLAKDQSEVPLGDRKNMCYMGSTVVYGRGKALISRTGMDTEMGKIAGALANTEQEQTPLQRQLEQLSTILSKLVLGICLFIFIFDLIVAGSFTLDSVLSTFMVAVSLAVAAIPEGLATVVTVVLSIGVTNMSHRNAVIRRLTAVETLGCTQVICSDKTGTLTQNKMTVVQHVGETAPPGHRHGPVQRRQPERRGPGRRRAHRGRPGQLCGQGGPAQGRAGRRPAPCGRGALRFFPQDDEHHPHRRRRLRPVHQGRPRRGAQALHHLPGERQGPAHDRRQARRDPGRQQEHGRPGPARPGRRQARLAEKPASNEPPSWSRICASWA